MIKTSSREGPTSVVERSTVAVEHSTAAVEHSTSVVERSTVAVEHSTVAVEPSTGFVESSTDVADRSTAAVEHTTNAENDPTKTAIYRQNTDKYSPERKFYPNCRAGIYRLGTRESSQEVRSSNPKHLVLLERRECYRKAVSVVKTIQTRD